MGRKLVYGVGINDADYNVARHEFVNGKHKRVWSCPYYIMWKSMLGRCYSEKLLNLQVSYKGCEVCEDWKYFSKFKDWAVKQNIYGNYLDKDLLYAGNRIYSPTHCVMVTRQVNNFITERNRLRGNFLLGVCYHKQNRKYNAQCNDPFDKSIRGYLGYFDTELEAHLAWKSRKHELAIQLANSEYVTDERVAQALINRYSGNGVYINAVLNNVPVEEFLQNREKYMQM